MKYIILLIATVYVTEAAKAVDVLQRQYTTLQSCAKACLDEKDIDCRFFKFVNTTGTCFLSARDRPDFKTHPKRGKDQKRGKDRAAVKKALAKTYAKVQGNLNKLKNLKKNMLVMKKNINKKFAKNNKKSNALASREKMDSQALRAHRVMISIMAKNIRNINLLFTWLKTFRSSIRSELSSVLSGNITKEFKYFRTITNKLSQKDNTFDKRFRRIYASNSKLWEAVNQVTNDLKVSKVRTLAPRMMWKLVKYVLGLAKRWRTLINNLSRLQTKLKIPARKGSRPNSKIQQQLAQTRRDVQQLKTQLSKLAAIPVATKGATPKTIKNVLRRLAKIDKFNAKVDSRVKVVDKRLCHLVRDTSYLASSAKALTARLDLEKGLTNTILKDAQNVMVNGKAANTNVAVQMSPMFVKALGKIHGSQQVLAGQTLHLQRGLHKLTSVIANQHKIAWLVKTALTQVWQFHSKRS